MKKQTAVEWLSEQLFELRNPTLNQIEIMEQAKELEKKQIINAFESGQQAEAKTEFWTKGTRYYTENYESRTN